MVPWGGAAVEYLDRRKAHTANGCPLPELFDAARAARPGLTVDEFHDGLRRLAHSLMADGVGVERAAGGGAVAAGVVAAGAVG